MNKTLLLIMCDFMLLNLLALTRWEKAEPSHTQLETAAPRSAANAPAVNADMVELMRVSLEDEKKSREDLATQLASTEGSLSEREKNLASLAQQKGQLENTLAATQASTRELEQRYTATSQEASMSREQLAKLQRTNWEPRSAPRPSGKPRNSRAPSARTPKPPSASRTSTSPCALPSRRKPCSTRT